MRVLLIEDHQRLARSIIEGLAGFGFGVDLFSTAGDGLAATRSIAYDAIILDLGLPDRDGLDVISDLRNGGARTPILVLTARDGIDNRVGSLAPGKDGDVALYDGDPFEYTTHCIGVVIDGCPYARYAHGFFLSICVGVLNKGRLNQIPKLEVVGSSPIARSKFPQ